MPTAAFAAAAPAGSLQFPSACCCCADLTWQDRRHARRPWAQAHAWVALGKLCLASEALAKRCVPLLVQELRAAAAPAVRNNIMVALADLCIQVISLCLLPSTNVHCCNQSNACCMSR